MFRRRLVPVLILVALGLSATAARALYKLAVTGETMAENATKFLDSLTAEQRAKAALAYDDKTRTDWHFIPKPSRKGMQVRDMNEAQRKAAHALLSSALSESGYGKATQIMAMEGLLHELEKAKGGKQIRDTERYFFTVFGTPGREGKWGLSVEGHHLSLNFVVDKGKVISTTPSAMGANPAVVMNENPAVPAIKKGTRVLAKEETLALELLASLTPDQKKEVVFAEKSLSEVRAAGQPQAANEAPKGMSIAKLTGMQRGILQSLIDEYANTFPQDVAKERLDAVKADGPEKTFFGWAGSEKMGEGHYYCIQGPSFQIEFVNTQPDSAGNPANHIHAVWRDLRGDFAIPVK